MACEKKNNFAKIKLKNDVTVCRFKSKMGLPSLPGTRSVLTWSVKLQRLLQQVQMVFVAKYMEIVDFHDSLQNRNPAVLYRPGPCIDNKQTLSLN